ncbi:MAG: hypothetical protein LBN10_03580 [Propionibacteriaceae bacterium]|jgi:hypothetical protein|nr:hypothetical protein [Propionibacteriaceae bacterium]
MGNRTYLWVSDPREDLFDTNNSLAGFWLGFLGTKTLDRVAPAWEAYADFEDAYEKDPTDELREASETLDLTFVVPRAEALENTKLFAAHIAAYYPTLSELYSQFKDYVFSQVDDDGSVSMDLYEYAQFDSTRQFIPTLRRYLSGMESGDSEALSDLAVDGDDLRAYATGWDLEDFAQFSPIYAEIDENDGVLPGTEPEGTDDTDDTGTSTQSEESTEPRADLKLTRKDIVALIIVLIGIAAMVFRYFFF